MSGRVVIVGGGIVGLCCAEAAQSRGRKVTVVSDGPVASDGNAGMIVPSHFEPLASPGMLRLGLRLMLRPESPFGVKLFADPDTLSWLWKFYRSANAKHVESCAPILSGLHLASRAEYSRLAGELPGDIGFRLNGLVMVTETEAALGAELKLADHAQSLGQSTKRLSRLEVEQRAGIDLPNIAGGVAFEDDAYLDPKLFMDAIRSRLVDRGAQFFSSRVHELVLSGGRITAVRTDAGELRGDEFVLAGGFQSSWLAQQIGLRLPLVAGKGYSFTFPGQAKDMSSCFIFVEARLAVTPMADQLRVTGTMVLGESDHSVDPRRISGMQSAAHRISPSWKSLLFEPGAAWVGHRPVSPDGLPYIGRTKKVRNLVVATGHGMMGVSLAPITGKLVSDALPLTDSPTILDILSPDRYA